MTARHAVDKAAEAEEAQAQEGSLEGLIVVPPAASPLEEAGHVVLEIRGVHMETVLIVQGRVVELPVQEVLGDLLPLLAQAMELCVAGDVDETLGLQRRKERRKPWDAPRRVVR